MCQVIDANAQAQMRIIVLQCRVDIDPPICFFFGNSWEDGLTGGSCYKPRELEHCREMGLLFYGAVAPIKPEPRKKQVQLHEDPGFTLVWLWMLSPTPLCSYSCALSMLYLIFILVTRK